MDRRLKGKRAALDVEGKLVQVHLAGRGHGKSVRCYNNALILQLDILILLCCKLGLDAE